MIVALLLTLAPMPRALPTQDRPPAQDADTAADTNTGADTDTGEETFVTLERRLPSGVVVTADLYRHPEPPPTEPPPNGELRPVIVAFHGANSSRGLYREIAPVLQAALGVHVLAVDLRHGGVGHNWDRPTKKRYGIPNETWISAKAEGQGTGRAASMIDLAAGVHWARELFPDAPLITLGSSFSATLVLVYAAEHPDLVDGVIACSPAAPYVKNLEVLKRIAPLSVPTYITCLATAGERRQAAALVQAVTSGKLVETWLPEKSEGLTQHGSRTLVLVPADPAAKRWAPVYRVLAAARERAAARAERDGDER